MSSFFEGNQQPVRTGKLSTHRNLAMKTLTLVAHTPACDTPPAGMPVLPRTAVPGSINAAAGRGRNTDPLPPVPMPPIVPNSRLEISEQMTARLPQAAQPGRSARPAPALTTAHTEQMTEGAKEMAQQGVNATFKAVLWATDPKVINQIERRDRVVFLLLDGNRTIHNIARLVHRNELDVARTIVHLLKQGYIIHIPVEEQGKTTETFAKSTF